MKYWISAAIVASIAVAGWAQPVQNTVGANVGASSTIVAGAPAVAARLADQQTQLAAQLNSGNLAGAGQIAQQISETAGAFRQQESSLDVKIKKQASERVQAIRISADGLVKAANENKADDAAKYGKKIGSETAELQKLLSPAAGSAQAQQASAASANVQVNVPGAQQQTSADAKVAVKAKSSAKIVQVGNKKCPISGEPVGSMEKGAHVDYKGYRVGLCCSGCKEKFLANADQYLKTAQAKAKE
jgi:hypothetical protein